MDLGMDIGMNLGMNLRREIKACTAITMSMNFIVITEI